MKLLHVHLVPFCQPCLVFVTTVYGKVVVHIKGCRVSSAGSLVHVVVDGVWLMATTSLLLSMAGRQ